MDFGAVVSLDHGFGVSSASSEAGFASHITSSSDPESLNKHKTLHGSGICCNKQERSECTAFDDYWRSSKLAKSNSDISDFAASKAMLQQRNSNLLTRSNSSLTFFDNNGHTQHQMLSFSFPTPKPDSFLGDKISQNAALPYFPNALSADNGRNIAGFNSVSLVNGGNMHREKGPFTQSQWEELEQQALIYKYITANVPIPFNLLIPIRKAFDSVGFSSFPPGLLRPNTLGWGVFHLGFSNNADPEPGRCRRTDGKKWRCSRDAVADHKYCERHMNRGRHRSRKPVEGQTGHSLAAAATSSSSSSVALPVGGGSTVSNSLSAAFNSYSADTTCINRMQSKSSLFSNPKHQIPYDESSRLESERTQLSISISSMSSSDNNHLSHRHDRQALNFIPLSWEPSVGGPLGEVLQHTANSNNVDSDSGDDKRPSSSASVLNLMTEGWDSSPPMGSSPKGVLQKTAFGSFSNSSAGSSPRADINKDLLLTSAAHLNSSSSSL